MKPQPTPTVPGHTPGEPLDLQAQTIAELASRCKGPNQFNDFDNAFRASLTASKEAIVAEEARLKRLRAKRRMKKRDDR